MDGEELRSRVYKDLNMGGRRVTVLGKVGSRQRWLRSKRRMGETG